MTSVKLVIFVSRDLIPRHLMMEEKDSLVLKVISAHKLTLVHKFQFLVILVSIMIKLENLNASPVKKVHIALNVVQ
jgi:hypothetical protein